MKIGILALQGAFLEHGKMLDMLGVAHTEIRRREHFVGIDGLILPGGESTVQGKLLREEGLFEPILSEIRGGMPVFGTCAGLILLAKKILNDENVYFGCMDMTVRRNAYGRQLGSFHTETEVKGIGRVPAVFIRAPQIESLGSGAEELAAVDGKIVAAKQKHMLVTAFHPELSDDMRIHSYFIDMVKRA